MHYNYPRFLFKILLLTIPLLFFCIYVSAQKQNNMWYFGANAGIDFNQSPPVALTDGKIHTQEGCASIAGGDGQLLFYTNSITIWNKKHLVMKNGDGLLGNESSTQGAIIVPCPQNNRLYFVFTTVDLEKTLSYSVVDITGDDGLGEVIVKNKVLLETSTEKLVAVPHANGKDFWVIGHKAQSNNFYAWLITKNGVSSTPVISATGVVHTATFSVIGYLRASPDGNRLVCAVKAVGVVEQFKFNRYTGDINDPETLTGFDSDSPYGVEFSPNGNLLYLCEYDPLAPTKIFQLAFPFTTGLISDKAIAIATITNIGALQLAPDGKIYVSQYNKHYLHSINAPNKAGSACDFEENTVDLKTTGVTRLGLPPFNFISADPKPLLATGFCFGQPTIFSLYSTAAYDDVTWDFNDPASGADNASHGANPSHQFSQPGDFNVKVTTVYNGVPTVYNQIITITLAITTTPVLTADKPLLCEKGVVKITASGATGSQKYNWYDAGKNLIVQNSGTYTTPRITANTTVYGSITNGTCEGPLQNIDIKLDEPKAIITATDTIINLGQSVTLSANTGVSYNWSPTTYLSNSTAQTTIATPVNNTTYTLTVTNSNGCAATATVNVIVKSIIAVPNTFTPNDDGVNDKWVIKNINYLQNFVQVYNRNGNLVYTAKNYDNSWDGAVGGKKLPAGVYYYRITLNVNEVKSGYVTILR